MLIDNDLSAIHDVDATVRVHHTLATQVVDDALTIERGGRKLVKCCRAF